MKGKRQILIIGIILGLITVFFLNRYITSINKAKEAETSIAYSEVLVAEKLIPAHIRITEDMVKLASLPTESVHPDALKSLEDVVGQISKAEIMSEEQILSSRVVFEDIEPILSYLIPEDMRAISLPINEVSGVGNNIHVGDRVDLLASYTMEEDGLTTFTQLQDIEVLALGKRRASTGEEGEEDEGGSTITLLVNPQQAEVIAYANIEGSLHFSLRNPIDNEKVNLDQYNLENFESFRTR